MRVILLGAPGSGKGTFAEFLTTYLGIPAISTGDLVRYEIKKGTAIGRRVADLAASGGLVPDDIVLEMVKRRLSKPDCQRGYILDGFPRTIEQARTLETFASIDIVLEIFLNEIVIIQTTVMRRNCSNCRKGYNLADIDLPGIRMTPLAPKVAGICDACGGKLVQRADDKEDIIRKRLDIYHKSTAPLKDFYKAQNKLVTFEVKRGKKDWPLLKAVVNEKIKEIREAKRQTKAKGKDEQTQSTKNIGNFQSETRLVAAPASCAAAVMHPVPDGRSSL